MTTPDAPRTEAPDLRAMVEQAAESCYASLMPEAVMRSPEAVVVHMREVLQRILSSATPAPERLDVERLARALYRVERGDVLPTTERREAYRRQKAEAIAAEYARLTEPQP